MTMNPCRRAFEQAQRNRRNHPLKSGVYKLDNALTAIRRLLRTMVAMYDHQNGTAWPGNPVSLWSCLSDEMDEYLQHTPAMVAEILGHDVRPAIAALEGDGLSPVEVQSLLRSGTIWINDILRECDRLHRRLESNVKREVRAIKSGKSPIYELVSDAERLIEDYLGNALWHQEKNTRANSALQIDVFSHDPSVRQRLFGDAPSPSPAT